MATSKPSVMIRDDGELSEVREALDDLGLLWVDGAKATDDALPTHMLISSGAHAVDALQTLRRQGAERQILHLVVIDRASRSLRSMLERSGCDMLARRPVHPTVIRLLTQRALYQGEEKRTLDRVAIGVPIKIKSGMLARNATLSELSLRGCGLVTRTPFSVGAEMRLTLPTERQGVEPLTLTGRVVGVKHGLALETGQHAAALIFPSLTRAESRRIVATMRAHAVGPTGVLEHAIGLDPGPAERHAGPHGDLPDQADDTGDGRDRRVTPRGAFGESVVARTANATHALLGCDLSQGGMRVAPDPSLRKGARLQLAIFGEGGVRPVRVIATVVRDDGEHGLGLRFEPLASKEQAQLERIVNALEQLGDTPAGTATVVGEVLGDA